MPRARRRCLEPDCDNPAGRRGRCTSCERQHDQARGSRQDRGYTAEHDAERAAWAPRVAAGLVHCRRGALCLEPSTLIEPGAPWDLGHPDAECSAPRAPEHRRCNRATAKRT